MSSVSTDPKKVIALKFLGLAAESLERAKRARLSYIEAAREQGLSHREIGDALGISEAAVRGLIARSK